VTVVVEQRNRALVAWLLVLSIVALNFVVRYALEDADKKIVSFLGNYYRDKLDLIFVQSPTWTLFLPIEALTGVWSTTGHILVYKIEQIIGPPRLFLLLNALTIVVAFVASWRAVGSVVFSGTLALCLGLGTWNHHTFAVPGGMIMYLMMIYMLANLLCVYALLKGQGSARLWNTLFVLSLVAMAMCYEQWLDYWVSLLVWGVALVALARGSDYAPNLRALRFVAVSSIVIAATYLIIRVPYHTSVGMENDTVHTYTSLVPAFEDFISNVIMHIYMAATTLLPVTGMSMALPALGPDLLMKQQFGYHAVKTDLVPMHYLFWWRYVAGAVFVIYLIGLWKVLVRANRQRSLSMLMLLFFVIMIGLGHATHDAIKFRPMNSAPVLTYHLITAVLGISLLVAACLTFVQTKIGSARGRVLLVGAVWFVVLLGALYRPAAMSYYSNFVGIGTYPDPMAKLKSLVRPAPR